MSELQFSLPVTSTDEMVVKSAVNESGTIRKDTRKIITCIVSLLSVHENVVLWSSSFESKTNVLQPKSRPRLSDYMTERL